MQTIITILKEIPPDFSHLYINLLHNQNSEYLLLLEGSKQSDECIGFTMKCVLIFIVLSVITFWSSKSVLIFNFNIISCRAVYRVGTLKGQKLKYPSYFQNNRGPTKIK